MPSDYDMDAAERRFRACVDRLKRDLTQIVFRSIDSMVDEALREARAAETSEPADVPAVPHSANGSPRRRKGRSRVTAAARTNEQSNGHGAAAGTSLTADDLAAVARASQLDLDLDLDLDLLRPKRKATPTRVRPDSVLGAELASQADGEEARVQESAGVLTTREPAPARAPTDRPLFVHKRARDGQIHALRRVREGAGPGVESRVESRPDARAVERR